MKKHIKKLGLTALAALSTTLTACGVQNSYQYAVPTTVNGSFTNPGYVDPYNQGVNTFPGNNLGGITDPNFTDPSLNANLPTGTIMGKVVDSLTKAGIGGVQVEVMGVRPARVATTDASGNFTLPQIPQGNQAITVRRNDYTNAAGNNQIKVTVKAGTTVQVPRTIENGAFPRLFS